MVRMNPRGHLIISILLFSTLCASTSGKIIYVDDDATGANDGTSWENAYTFLQDALADANSAEKPVEIQVAQGIYKPDQGTKQTLGNREATFHLIDSVTIKGGYAGFSESEPDSRDIQLYETILSGDLKGDDTEVASPRYLFENTSRSENSYHVVSSMNTEETTILDGFTITSGVANGTPRNNAGGGFFNDFGSPTLVNCTFKKNWANNGGGLFNESGNLMLFDCVLKGNYSNYGGGIFNWRGSPLFRNCRFSSNFAQHSGGGIWYGNANPEFIGCIFSGNIAQYRDGGGMLCQDSKAILNNCTFSGNSALFGGAVSVMMNHEMILRNCILWDNLPEDNEHLSYQITVSYSNVPESWLWGERNINTDPLFADTGYWANVNDANNFVEPNDPNAVWIDGDYHLRSQAGRWDPVSESWVVDDVTSPCIDTGDPNSPVGDEPEPNGDRINMGAYGGTDQASMSPVAEQIINVQWLGHSTVKVWTDDCIVYVDPERVPETLHDATLVCVTHAHGDHYSPTDISKVSNAQTQFIAPPDVVQRYGSGLNIAPGQTSEFDFVTIKAVPSYNTNKPNHPKSNNWVGYIIELAGKRVYVAGDTDLIEEMKSLGDINLAFLPAGGTYTMNATEAAEATGYIKPDLAIPYHWGQNTGTITDAQRFVELARCPAMVMAVGETISSDNWPEYSPLIAHWAFDETEGDVAHDSAGENHITLFGEPAWQPDGGKIDGALQFDGINDYGITDFVLDPANGPFSVFAWIKGGAAGQTVISQADGMGSGETWLGTDPLLGKLMTGLVPPAAGRFVPQPLISESIVIDGQWHHIGFVWDGSYRSLYVDGTEVAKDAAAQNPLKSADGGLYIGADKTLAVGTFFSGLIDDIHIYNVALDAEQIEEFAY
jgi:L-ascorbate metabolism protein UlaG (beta-lactamase superfamily)